MAVQIHGVFLKGVSATPEKKENGVKYVLAWRSPCGPHCVYAREWDPTKGQNRKRRKYADGMLVSSD